MCPFQEKQEENTLQKWAKNSSTRLKHVPIARKIKKYHRKTALFHNDLHQYRDISVTFFLFQFGFLKYYPLLCTRFERETRRCFGG